MIIHHKVFGHHERAGYMMVFLPDALLRAQKGLVALLLFLIRRDLKVDLLNT